MSGLKIVENFFPTYKQQAKIQIFIKKNKKIH